MTLGDYVFELCNTNAWAWLATWYNPFSSSVIVKRHDRVCDVKSFDIHMDSEISRIGWSGLSTDGHARWVGWDIDVGHGKNGFKSVGQALRAAVGLWLLVDGEAEVRFSASGEGIHVRHPLKVSMPNDKALALAKVIASRIAGVDPTPTGRQTFWFWAANVQPRSYRQLLPLCGGYTDE